MCVLDDLWGQLGPGAQDLALVDGRGRDVAGGGVGGRRGEGVGHRCWRRQRGMCVSRDGSVTV